MSGMSIKKVDEKTVKAPAMPTINLSEGHPMTALIDSIFMPPAAGDIVEGTIINMVRGRVYIDLHPFGTGLIYGREYLNAADVLRKTNNGDIISAKVVDPAGRDGYIELSLKEARQAAIWGEAETAILSQTPYSLVVEEANKGGLILSWQGLPGFLPASQLSKEHYPRVPAGDKEKIFAELLKLVGHPLSVRIITADAKDGKLIFSEKTENETSTKTLVIDKYQVGDEADGEVTGIVDFGVFVKIDSGLEGLVHLSELDWGLVEDPRAFCAVGDKVRVKVIDLKDGKISFSIKALKENPWKTAAGRYEKGKEVPGVIIKYNKHGALASIEEGIAGLVHVSEFSSPSELRSTLELGKTYPFIISLFEPSEQRMTLTFVGKKSDRRN